MLNVSRLYDGKLRLLYLGWLRCPKYDGRFLFGTDSCNSAGRLFMKNKGFTLIEILIVVLIIGILAAISVSKYQKAVAKSKGEQLKSLLSQITASLDRYFLYQGKYPSTFENLDISIDLPTTNGLEALQSVTCGANLIAGSYKRGDDFEIALYTLGVNEQYMLSAHFTKGKYKCRGFVHYLSGGNKASGKVIDGLTFCGEYYYGRQCGTLTCEPGLFCKDVMGLKKKPNGNSIELYQ